MEQYLPHHTYDRAATLLFTCVVSTMCLGIEPLVIHVTSHVYRKLVDYLFRGSYHFEAAPSYTYFGISSSTVCVHLHHKLSRNDNSANCEPTPGTNPRTKLKPEAESWKHDSMHGPLRKEAAGSEAKPLEHPFQAG
jgi:hypothetical protein